MNPGGPSMHPEFESGLAKTESIIMRLRAPGAMPIHHGDAAGFVRRIRRIFNDGIDKVFG